jgi:Polyketide cyclase / dehydrase and lipid transport
LKTVTPTGSTPAPRSTVTSAVECASSPTAAYGYLADPRHLPDWAPGFADTVRQDSDGGWAAAKGDRTFAVRVDVHEPAGTVDFLRQAPSGRWIGAYLRVTPQPQSGSVITMTLPLLPDTDPSLTARVLEEELAAIVRLLATG